MVTGVREGKRSVVRPGFHHGWSRAGGPAAPNPFAGRRPLIPIPAAVAVPVMCLIVAAAFVLSVLVVTAGHPAQRAILAGSAGVLVLWGVLLMVPFWVRRR